MHSEGGGGAAQVQQPDRVKQIWLKILRLGSNAILFYLKSYQMACWIPTLSYKIHTVIQSEADYLRPMYSDHTEFDSRPKVTETPTFCPLRIWENYFQLCIKYFHQDFSITKF